MIGLVIAIETGQGEAVYREAVVELPGVTFDPIVGGWRAEITVDDEPALARHLVLLAELSRDHPTWELRVEIDDGGTLHLRAGSFGDDAEEVAQLLAWTAPTDNRPDIAEATGTLSASFELPRDAHQHFLGLVMALIPAGWDEPVIQVSDEAIAIGFALTGDEARTVQLVEVLRAAWSSQGSLARCRVEVDGATPHVATITQLQDWTALEEGLRPKPSEPQALPLRTLTWLDDRGRCFALVGGVVGLIPARIEAASKYSSVVRRSDGSWRLRTTQTSIELRADPSFEREVLVCDRAGIVLVERRGDTLRLRILDGLGHRTTPVIAASVAAVDLARRVAYVANPDLVTIDLQTIAIMRSRPWGEDLRVSALGILGERLVVVADGEVHLIGGNGALERSIYVPCSNATIAGLARDELRLLGEGRRGAPISCASRWCALARRRRSSPAASRRDAGVRSTRSRAAPGGGSRTSTVACSACWTTTRSNRSYRSPSPIASPARVAT